MKSIPMLDLQREYLFMKKDIDAAIKKCLTHQRWILGPEVQELEEKIAKYLNAKHCIGISSGTDALVVALRALALQRLNAEYFTREHKIITTPFTFTATGDAILRAGATPVFIDIDTETFNIDPSKIRAYLNKEPQNVVGIIPVHLYGQTCNMEEIMEIAQKFKLFVVEDVAQAFGGEWASKKLGTVGDMGAFSFFPSKNLGGFGDGGMISTDNQNLAEISRMLIKHGGRDKYNVDHIGYNARLDTIQAAVLMAKLKYIDEFNAKRRNIARLYNLHLGPAIGIKTPKEQFNHVYHQYTIQVSNGRREALQNHLKNCGIDTMVYYPILLHKMKVFEKRCEAASVNNAEIISSEVISLPIEPLLKKEDVVYIAEQIKKNLNS